jgi:hypothetical protein
LLLADAALVALGAAIADVAGGADAGTEAAAMVVGVVAEAVAAVVDPVDVAGTADGGTGGNVSTAGNNTGSEAVVAVAGELSAMVVGAAGAVATVDEDAVVGAAAGANDGSFAFATRVKPAESVSRPSRPSNEPMRVMLLFAVIIGTSTFFAPCSRNIDRLRSGTTIRSLRTGPGAGR